MTEQDAPKVLLVVLMTTAEMEQSELERATTA